MTQILPLSAKGVAFMTYSFSGEKKGGGIGEEKSSDLNGTHFCVF